MMCPCNSTLHRKITNRKGTVVYRPEIEEKRVLSEETADLMTHMLIEAMQSGT